MINSFFQKPTQKKKNRQNQQNVKSVESKTIIRRNGLYIKKSNQELQL